MDQQVAIIIRESVDSTMKLARREIDAGTRTGPAFYLANEQTAGVGRQGRVWHSPPGGLWSTLAWPILPDAQPDKDAVLKGLGLRVGVAVLTVIGDTLTRGASGQAPMLKWPNDILINGHKVAGSLCESHAGPTEGPWETPPTWLLIGVGINVNNELPDASKLGEHGRPPIALRSCVQGPIDVKLLAQNLLGALCHAATTAGLPPKVLEIARARLFRGRRLNLIAPGGYTSSGELVGLNDEGMPIVKSGDATFEVPPGSEFV